MAQDTTTEQRRARILVAAGITPDAELTEGELCALATIEAQPPEVVDAILAMLMLLVAGRRPVDPPPSSGRMYYPDPRPRPRNPGPLA